MYDARTVRSYDPFTSSSQRRGRGARTARMSPRSFARASGVAYSLADKGERDAEAIGRRCLATCESSRGASIDEEASERGRRTDGSIGKGAERQRSRPRSSPSVLEARPAEMPRPTPTPYGKSNP
ncbi:hypothetical protein KM043_003339 [Ampulex compressa]|nr:hypothetical protein KM043_003339 [Ampulex compressa]